MKGKIGIFGMAILIILASCTKEYSLENGGNNGDGLIVGADCRISNIVSHDSATLIALSSIAARINARDTVTNITQFDSLGNNLLFSSSPVYFADTIFIDADEYFLQDLTSGRIVRLHGLYDPTDLSSEFDADYIYDASGYLVQKVYTLAMFPGFPVLEVDYFYSGGNLVHSMSTDLTISAIIGDADVDYYSNITPKNYMNIMPDEGNNLDFNRYAQFTQFFNFGKKPLNAVKKMTVRDYLGGDSTVTDFKTYIMSRDNYVLSVYMNGDDQPSIPAEAGRLYFSYHCK